MTNIPSLAKSNTDLAQLVTPVLDEELYWFPIRHHSPAAAHFVSKAIAARKPKCLLLEAPAHLQHLLPFLLKKTKPPVALYSSARNDNDPSAGTRVSWFPLLDYSPEWQAIQSAEKIGAEIIFIDLPHYCQPTEENRQVSDSSSFFQALSDQAGYLNWHECWDSLFENTLHQSAPYDFNQFREQLLYFAAAARTQSNATTSPATLSRECYMWGNICRAIKRYKPNETMVVCGALHLLMARDNNNFVKLQKAVTRTEKKLSLNTTIVPYSYRRIALQHGYAAGNRAPWFYQQQWRNKKHPENTTLEHIHRILSSARKLGHTISAADTLAVAHHAELLAQLRNRQLPVLDDIEDAVWACCCKGDPSEHGARISKAITQANIGKRIGVVNQDLGQIPLVADFYAQLHLLDIELPELDSRKMVQVDLRTPEGLAQSQLLHRLRVLELPCVRIDSQLQAFKASLFAEKWTLLALGGEEALIEYSEYGDTIDSVVQNKITENIKNHIHEIDDLASILLDSQVTGLGVFYGEVEKHFRNGLQQNVDFVALTTTFKYLLQIWQQQKFLASVEPPTEPLLELCFLRATLSLGKVKSVADDDQPLVVNGLRIMAETWLSENQLQIDRQLFEDTLVQLADDSNVLLLNGCAFGLLLETGMRSVTDFSTQVKTRALGSSRAFLNTAIWIEGVMYTSKVSILSGAGKISEAINSLLMQASQPAFISMLPRLRAGFEALPRVQREALALSVAKMYGLASTEELTIPVGQQQDLSELDSKVQSVMQRLQLDS